MNKMNKLYEIHKDTFLTTQTMNMRQLQEAYHITVAESRDLEQIILERAPKRRNDTPPSSGYPEEAKSLVGTITDELDDLVTEASVEGNLEWLERARDNTQFPAGTRLAAAKEAGKLRLELERDQRESRDALAWSPPSTPWLLAQAIRDVIKLQSSEVREEITKLSVVG